MKTITQFKFDALTTDEPVAFPEAFPNPKTNNFKLTPTNFPLKRIPFWRILFLLVGLVIISFLVGYPWAGITVAVGYGFLLEKALVNNAYFGGLENRVFTDVAGKSWLEVTRKQTMDKFLDAELRLTVISYGISSMADKYHTLYQETVNPRLVARQLGDRYIIPLPIPPLKVLALANRVEWRLDWSHTRRFAFDVGYQISLRLKLD